jgi:succinoglycan biosynthesis transport protein ExoP
MKAEEGSLGVTLREILTVVFKRKWLILTVAFVIFAGAAIGAMLAPREYEANAILMMTRARADLTVTPFDASSGALALRLTPSQDLVGESELLKRRSLLLHIVKTLGSKSTLSGRLPSPDGSDEAQAPSDSLFGQMREMVTFVRPAGAGPARILAPFATKEPLSQAELAVQALARQLKVAPVDNTNLIKVTLAANDPAYAGKVLDLLLGEYLEQYVQMRTNPGAVQFFETQVTTLARELREAEDAKQTLEQKYGVRRLETQTDLYLKAASDREAMLQAARTEADGLREKVRMLRDQLERMPEKVRASEEIRVNPMQDAMRAKLFDLEIQRNKALQLYTDDDRRVQDLEREITLLRQRLTTEPNVEFAKESYGQNPTRLPVQLELVNAESQLVGTTVKVKNLEQDLREAEGRLDQMSKAVYDRTRLERKVKMLEENYLVYAKKYEEARISSAMDKNRIVNISVVEPVNIAAKPGVNGRSGLQLALMGAAFGLVLGVGGAFGREYLDRSFSTEENVRRQLNLPVLGSIPEDKK